LNPFYPKIYCRNSGKLFLNQVAGAIASFNLRLAFNPSRLGRVVSVAILLALSGRAPGENRQLLA
jgi:hypothetical protein